MALNQRAEARFAGVERGHLQQVAEFVDKDALVHGIEPRLHLAEKFEVGLFRQIALRLREVNLDVQLLSQREINRKNGTRFRPLNLPWAGAPRGRGNVQSFVHSDVIQSQGPCEKRTATALRPS